MSIVIIDMHIALIPKLLRFAATSINAFRIDESHGLSHAMNVLHHSHNILQSELSKNPFLEQQRNIIYTSAILHDICDKKYMTPKHGIRRIKNFLYTNTSLTYDEIETSSTIMETMSYSTVKQYGYPDLGEYQKSYHIVREADLLAAYDFDRSIIYNMNNVDDRFVESFDNAFQLFGNRVFMHGQHDLLVTDYTKSLSKKLEQDAYRRIQNLDSILSHDHHPFFD